MNKLVKHAYVLAFHFQSLHIMNKSSDLILIDKPESKSLSKFQAPSQQSQIQKGKGVFGLWAVSKFLWLVSLDYE